MHVIETLCIGARHAPILKRMDWLWNRVRPTYDSAMNVLGRQGLTRTINGTDTLRVAPRARGVHEVYEPELWSCMMAHVRPGDTVADVGASLGLYTIALAKRVGGPGRVISFEPDPESYLTLRQHVAFNAVADRVELSQAAVSDSEGTVEFAAGHGLDSHISAAAEPGAILVKTVCLDMALEGRRLDLLKVDVEGEEERVLRGATQLLRTPGRAPRVIFVEVHPFAWHRSATSSTSLLSFLRECGYGTFDLAGEAVRTVSGYGTIVARPAGGLL